MESILFRLSQILQQKNKLFYDLIEPSLKKQLDRLSDNKIFCNLVPEIDVVIKN